MIDSFEHRVLYYRTLDGACPFAKWKATLGEAAASVVNGRIARLQVGNFGLTRSVGNGVNELKIDFGPGYRIYFGMQGLSVVIILCGGIKDSQDRDVKKAHKYWKEFRRRTA